MTTTRSDDLSQSPTLRDTFAAAVMNWISEATSVYASACRSDGGRRIMADACCRCWDAYGHETDHDAAPAARASEATASPERVRVRGDAGTGDTPWLNYNANDYVRVKLTAHGHELLKKQHESLNAMTAYLRYLPPVEDADGWSKWQLHRLMNTFGAHTGMGLPLCFEPTIQFDSARANLDAAPAARARTDADTARTDNAATGPGEGTGDTPAPHATPSECSLPRDGMEPAAWAVLDSRGTVCVAYVCREAAEAYCEGTFNRLAPLYRHPQPALTDAEREAVEIAAEYVASAYGVEHHAATLRGLLERL